MSRRQRRKAEAKTKGRWLPRLVVGGLIGAVVVAGGSYLWLRSWLHGDEFRQLLSEKAGDALDVNGEFGSFRWSGTRMDTTSFSAEGQGVVSGIYAEGLRVQMDMGGWWNGVWQVNDARVRNIEVEVDTTAADRSRKYAKSDKNVNLETIKSKPWYQKFIPEEVALRQLEVGNSSLSVVTRSGKVGISGTSWQVLPDLAKGSYRAEGANGTLILPWEWAPTMALGRARLRYQGDTVFLTDADFQIFESGRLDLSGEMRVDGDGYIFNGDLRDVMCSEILPESWKQRLTGVVAAEFFVEDGAAGPVVEGSIDLTDGIVTALPVFDSLSAYADTTRFRRFSLQEGSADFAYIDGGLTLKNVKIGSNGLIRVEGAIQMDRKKRLDGQFRLGLVPGLLAQIPGAETVVFKRGERGLLWADVRVGGTLDHPEEDLTARLIEAAGLRMFEVLPETGERVLKFTREVIGEDLQEHLKRSDEVIDQGREAIREAEGVVREVRGIFDVIRGKDSGEKE